MTDVRDKSLILIPDYLSVHALYGAPSDALVIGDPKKVPGELRTDRFLDVNDELTQRSIMQLVPEVARATVMTPSLAFYRRLYELRDDCFFADLASRLIAGGAYVSVESGMQREKVPRRAAEWLNELAADGVRVIYKNAPPEQAKAKDLVTAADVAAYAKQGRRELIAAPHAIVTPYARDEAKEKGITIVIGTGGQP